MRPVNARRANQLITHCKALDAEPHSVVVLGEALFDCLADQKGVRKEEVTSWTACAGGAPANVACALAQLGTQVCFIGNLGKDDYGNKMADLLASRGIDLSGLERTDHLTRDVLVERSLEGDRTFAGFGKAEANEYADCFIDEDKLPEEKLKNADILVTGTLGLAYPQTATAMRRAVKLGRSSKKCAVMVDVNWRPVFWGDEDEARKVIVPYVQEADLLKVTDEEAEWLFAIPAAKALEDPTLVLKATDKAKGVLVTAGSRGSSYAFHSADGSEILTKRVPVLKVDVLDTTGAGDGFLGGFLHFLVKKGGLKALVADPEQLRRAVEFGTACGAYVTKGAGAIEPQPRESDVAEFLGENWDFETAPKDYFDLEV